MLQGHFNLNKLLYLFVPRNNRSKVCSCSFILCTLQTVAVPGEEKITRKDLAHSLHICLSQTNEFSEFLLPLIMEKLESSSVDAKIDSLELLVGEYLFPNRQINEHCLC